MTGQSMMQRVARSVRYRRARRRLGSSAIVGVLAVASALAPCSASADLILSAGAGGVVPWEGSGNYSAMGSIGFNPFSDYSRLVFEFEYRSQDTTVDLRGSGFGVIKLPLDTYDLRAIFQFVFNPGGLTPYVGLGGGFKLIALDDRGLKVAIGLPPSIAATKSYGVAGGILGLVGFEFPIVGPSLALYVEARADYNWELTDGTGAAVDNDNLGAFVGMGGLRFSF